MCETGLGMKPAYMGKPAHCTDFDRGSERKRHGGGKVLPRRAPGGFRENP